MVRLSCENMVSANPRPRPERFCVSCWSSIEVYIFSCWLLNMPSEGVASRMLLSTICMNITSNCFEACFIPSCGEVRTVRRRASTPCTSSDRRWSSTLLAVEFRLLRLGKPALLIDDPR